MGNSPNHCAGQAERFGRRRQLPHSRGNLGRGDARFPKRGIWFQETQAQAPVNTIAYFSMEFMLGEALPIYSGGLGNVAGDQLKAASDLGVPVVGIGLLYQEGYFRQAIAADGSQLALYPVNDPGQLPIRPLRDASGEWVRLQIHLPGYKVWVRAWEAQVGRVKLYLLDLNDPENPPIVRGITNEFMVAGWRCASPRKSCWVSAAGGCCEPWDSIPKCAISMKATRLSPCWNGPRIS